MVGSLRSDTPGKIGPFKHRCPNADVRNVKCVTNSDSCPCGFSLVSSTGSAFTFWYNYITKLYNTSVYREKTSL